MKNIFSILLLLFISISYSQVRFEGIITDSEGNTIMGANVIAVEKESKVLDGFGISSFHFFYSNFSALNVEYEYILLKRFLCKSREYQSV